MPKDRGPREGSEVSKDEGGAQGDSDGSFKKAPAPSKRESRQLPLIAGREPEQAATESSVTASLSRIPKVRSVSRADLAATGVDIIVLGLGFEERTLTSATRLLDSVTPSGAVLVRYAEKGYADAIEQLVRHRVQGKDRIQILDSRDFGRSPLKFLSGSVLVDVTGLAKSVLFKSVLHALSRDRRVTVAHTLAQQHYPLNSQIEQILQGQVNGADYEILERASSIWSGEHKPYSFDKLIGSDADESRRRLLCAAASPKHERILSLLDERSFDHVDIVAPKSQTPRSRLAKLAADVATRGLESSSIEYMDSDDLEGLLRLLGTRFSDFYVSGCQGRCENVPAGRSKTVPLNAVEWASRFVGRWRSGSVR